MDKPTSMEGRKNTPTMREVAQIAGVGIATVSRVLNKSPLVAPEKAQHVRNVMAELGYNWGSMKKRRSKAKSQSSLTHRTIGVLLTGKRNLQWVTNCAPVYAYVLHGIEVELSKRGFNCLIRQIATPADAEVLNQSPIDALLVLGGDDAQDWRDILKQYPCVKMLGVPASDWCDCITYNSDTIGYLAADYLSAQGVRHAAAIGSSQSPVFSRRKLSFAQHLASLGCSYTDLTHNEIIRNLPNTNVADKNVVRALVQRLVNEVSPKPEGIFVMSDVITPVVYQELERQGVMPGKDITVVSCNNEKPYLAPLHPQPAVIDIRAEAIGQQAVERLFWRIENPDAPKMTLIIEPNLILPPVE